MHSSSDPSPRPTTPRPFNVAVHTADGWAVVVPSGEIDLATADQVRAALTSAGSVQLALDLRDVEFLDSSGVRVIVEEHHRAESEQRTFAVVPGPPAVRRILEIAGVTERLHLIDEPPVDPPR